MLRYLSKPLAVVGLIALICLTGASFANQKGKKKARNKAAVVPKVIVNVATGKPSYVLVQSTTTFTGAVTITAGYASKDGSMVNSTFTVTVRSDTSAGGTRTFLLRLNGNVSIRKVKPKDPKLLTTTGDLTVTLSDATGNTDSVIVSVLADQDAGAC
jgi:hypothetical protein